MDDPMSVIVRYKQRLEKETKADKVLRLLQKLKSLPITVELLQVTGIGKTVSALRKWDGNVGSESRKLVTEWKQVVNESGTKRTKEEGGHRSDRDRSNCGSGTFARNRTEDGYGRPPVAAHDHGEINGVCDRPASLRESRHVKKGSSVDKEVRVTRSGMDCCSPRSSPSKQTTPPPPPANLSVTKKNNTENKSKRKLVDSGGDGFNASMASFEDCLGLNDVKPRGAPATSSSSASSKTKKSVKTVERPNLTAPNQSDWTPPKSAKNNCGALTETIIKIKQEMLDNEASVNVRQEPHSKPTVKVRQKPCPEPAVKVKHERHSPTSDPYLMDATPSAPLPLIKKPPMNDVDILSNLPAIQTDYKPLRFFPTPDSPPPLKRRAFEMDSTTFMSSRHTRTQVFSGRKHQQYLTEVPSLVKSCVRVLQDNVSVLYDLMYAPYDIIRPVLLRCSPQRLQFLEDNNEYLLDETDDLWKALCQKQFKGVEPDEFESWRELHCRLSIARDNKLKSITANISRSMAKAVPVRQTKLAFLDCDVKPPRAVARQQAKFGTASKSASKEQVVKLHCSAGGMKSHPGASRSSSTAAVHDPGSSSSNNFSSSQQQKVVKKVAPLMQKTLKFMKNRFRR